MARIKYYYDTDTCKYERVRVTKWDVFLNASGFLAVCLIFAFLIFFVAYNYFDSPKERVLLKENKELKQKYKILDDRMKEVDQILLALQERDDNVYRTIFEAEPIPTSIRSAGVGGVNRYKDLLAEDLEQEELIIKATERLDKLKQKMYIQTRSYDRLIELAKNKEKLWASIPAIQPVSNKELKRLSSGFGMRMHPILKRKIRHHGFDYSAPRGTPIYATGDGVVKKLRRNGAYGIQVMIDHGYGYMTRYAHMQKYIVKRGQKVKRGQCIGYVGNTGRSTAPHLHYEVLKNNKPVNPINYIFQGITPEEYDELLKLASIENQSLS
ncbi:MAG: M23 family metallopeptidase [Cytophagales bacterium]|nr:M23 family metallopeptidase [Cytophagales bacterium]